MALENFGIKKYFFWVSIFLILAFTSLNPEGSRGIDFISRLILWFFQIGILMPILIANILILQKSKYFDNFNPWIKVIISGFVGSFLFLPFALFFDYIFGLDDWQNIDSTKYIFLIIIDEIQGVLPSTIIVWIAINSPFILQLNFRNDQKFNIDKKSDIKNVSLATQNNSHEIINKFQRIGNDLIYIKSELHYLRIVTTKGEDLILYNMKDAIIELENYYQGLLVHRSFWVVKKHCRKIIKKQNQHFAKLSNDSLIPISRRKISFVRDFLQKT